MCPKCGGRIRLGHGYSLILVVAGGFGMVRLIKQKPVSDPVVRTILAVAFLLAIFLISPLFVTVKKWED